MIIRDTPSDIEQYFVAEGELAFELQQAGYHPQFIDYDAVYFKKNHKLIKYLNKIGIKV